MGPALRKIYLGNWKEGMCGSVNIPNSSVKQKPENSPAEVVCMQQQ